MKPVAEFVEQRLGIVKAEEGRFAGSRLAAGKIIVVDDNRRDRLVHVLLVAVAARPGARALARPGEIVVQKKTDVTAEFVANLPDPHVGVINRKIVALGEGEPEQPPGGAE